MNNYKTLGKISAYLISKLYDNNKHIFTINDAQDIIKKNYNQTTDLLSELVKRKVISRLKSGKFIIIPQEIGNVEEFIGNWFIAAREIVNSPDYYIGFYSAMNHWGMLTQPLVKVFIATPKRQIVPKQLKGKFVFINISKKFIWAIKDEWVTQTEKVRISNPEKTILDGLLFPQHCGGITEIAKGFWIIRNRIDFTRLKEYVKRYKKNVIIKRLGYILETLEINENNLIDNLKKDINNRYDLLDPKISSEKSYKNNWHLIDNIGKEQILNIIKY